MSCLCMYVGVRSSAVTSSVQGLFTEGFQSMSLRNDAFDVLTVT